MTQSSLSSCYGSSSEVSTVTEAPAGVGRGGLLDKEVSRTRELGKRRKRTG